MNKIKRIVCYLLVACLGLVQTGCMGSFKLTNVAYQWKSKL